MIEMLTFQGEKKKIYLSKKENRDRIIDGMNLYD